MLEDDDEWFGYGFLSDHSDSNDVERQVMDNVQYLEYHCRGIGLEKKEASLARRISALFDRLPIDCEGAITDHREALIRAVVNFRNRAAHGKYDSLRPTSERLLALSIKLATLPMLNDTLDGGGPDATMHLSRKRSPYLRKMLALSDQPQSPTREYNS